MFTRQQFSSFSTCIFAPLACLTSLILAPRAPMMPPVAVVGNSKELEVISLTWSSPPLPAGPSPLPLLDVFRGGSFSSAVTLTMTLALSTWSFVPVMWTLQMSSTFSTVSLAPLCCRISAIFEPFVPMILPVTFAGSSRESVMEGPSPSLEAACLSCCRIFSTTSRIMALAMATRSGLPLSLNSHSSSLLSSASMRAPLRSRISLIISPCLPITRPMRLRGNLRISSLLGLPPERLRLQLPPGLPAPLRLWPRPRPLLRLLVLLLPSSQKGPGPPQPSKPMGQQGMGGTGKPLQSLPLPLWPRRFCSHSAPMGGNMPLPPFHMAGLNMPMPIAGGNMLLRLPPLLRLRPLRLQSGLELWSQYFCLATFLPKPSFLTC
mmetsp:Transcript_22756/g.50292  ORF Transcript_22756/g.50292 Transcript_22756/m.50292 type:complete len:377 (+) Transcript_22756:555-1685(+)